MVQCWNIAITTGQWMLWQHSWVHPGNCCSDTKGGAQWWVSWLVSLLCPWSELSWLTVVLRCKATQRQRGWMGQWTRRGVKTTCRQICADGKVSFATAGVWKSVFHEMTRGRWKELLGGWAELWLVRWQIGSMWRKIPTRHLKNIWVTFSLKARWSRCS